MFCFNSKNLELYNKRLFNFEITGSLYFITWIILNNYETNNDILN